RRRLYSPLRWRVTTGIDLVVASFVVLSDPLVFSPWFLVFPMAILGNGMRCGRRLFAETVIGGLFAAVLVLSFRFPGYINVLLLGTVLLALCFVIVMVYSNSLTAR